MVFSLILLGIAVHVYLLHFLNKVISVPFASQVVMALMGVSLICIILSTACFFMNMGFYKVKQKKIWVNWMIVSAVAFILFIAYIGLCLIERANENGISIFEPSSSFIEI